MTLTFVRADLTQHRDILMRFNINYVEWVAQGILERHRLALRDLLGMSIPDYVAGALDKLCNEKAPIGIFYLVFNGDEAVGMGGLRPVLEGVCEVKRIYVPHNGRGHGVGAAILERLTLDACTFGYQAIVLETGPFMTSAHRLYEAIGFIDIPPYLEAEVPGALHHDWRFMRYELG